MANRAKTERNRRIMELYEKGWLQASIARMYHMKPSAVSMVILRERERLNNKGGNNGSKS